MLDSARTPRSRRVAARLATAAAGLLLAALAPPAAATAAPALPLLVDVRAAQHPGYDRLVFEFSGPLPTSFTVGYVPVVTGDATGEPIPISGNVFLQVRFFQSSGHDDSGTITYGPTRRAYPLPNIMHVVNAGDFEGVLTFGVGLSSQTAVTVTTLTAPSRVVVDIGNAFTTVQVTDWFIQAGDGSLTPEAVTRPVIPPATARGALQRLFAGPTQQELAAGLRLVNSDATGFTALSITNGLARVQLTGGCNSHGATTTIATELMLTLKQFPTVSWVKIFDPAGATERPTGNTDSIPECLEP